MVRVFLKNMGSGKEFEVIGRDKEAGTITLKGDYAQFTEKFDKDRLKEAGYEMVQRQDDDPVPTAPGLIVRDPQAAAEEDSNAYDETEEDEEFSEFGEPGDEDE